MERIHYGSDQFQFADLRLPAGNGPHPVLIVIHGGFWRAKYDLEYIAPTCEAFTAGGVATWNIEYRRIGHPGGGWHGTLDDVAAAQDYLQSVAPRFHLDINRVTAIGHSAGGHLALWLGSRKRALKGAIALAGVVDLRRAWELGLSNNVVRDFLGGSPEEVPDRYQFASPIERLPLGIPQKLFHGTKDPNVPHEISERYVRTAHLRGDDAELITLDDVGHFELVDPRTHTFQLVRDAVLQMATFL
jgi:acetyl esterase/lipase